MKTNQNTTNNQNVQDLLNQLSGLADEAKKDSQEFDEFSRGIREEIAIIKVKVDESINGVEQIFSDLDQIEKEAGDELDELMLKQAEDLAAEDRADEDLLADK